MTSIITINSVNKDSNAEKSGLLVDDIILQLNKVEIKNIAHFIEVWQNCNTNDDKVILVLRAIGEIEIHMKEPDGMGVLWSEMEVDRHSNDKIKNRIKTNDKNLENAIELICKNESELNGEITEELEAFYGRNNKIIDLHSGDTLLENLSVGNAICLINGNLIVKNTIEDSQEVDSTLLIVLGDVKCKNLITSSSIFIKGNLSVENVILADSGCNLTLTVLGDIKTKTILEYGHSINGYKKVKAKNIFSFNSIEDEKGAIEANLTSEDLVDEIVEIDNDERIENLSNTIDFIKNGGTKFIK
jgi:hypothetical protein